ncbi:hypothetical protein VPHK469_0047 [Vibrio phage K469]
MIIMTPERWGKLNKPQRMIYEIAKRFRDNRCKGSIKNFARRDKCPHVMVHMKNGQAPVSLTYFYKRREVQVFDNYNNFNTDQNIWTFKKFEHAVDFVIRGLEGYNDVIEHRVRQFTGGSTTLIHRKQTQKRIEKCHH